MNPLKLLLIDNSEADYQLVKGHLSNVGSVQIQLDWVSQVKEAEKFLLAFDYDFFLIEDDLKPKSGIELLRFARRQGVDKPIIILTEKEDRQIDFAAMIEGADDYIIKQKISESNIERSIRYSFERYKSRLRLEQRESRYRNLFEKSIDSIAITNIRLEIKEANQAMNQLFKISLESLKDKSLKEFFAEKDVFDEFLEKVHRQGLVKKFQARMHRSDGQRLFCEITTAVLFNLNHEVNGYHLIINDLTKEKKSEQRILRAEKLGITGRIARSIAHEVRNPLTNINLALDQLRDEFGGEESSLMYLDIIGRNSERINKLISELLNSAKPSALKIVNNSIKKLVDESLDLARDRLRLKEIQLIREETAELEVPFDYVSLKTAILNIIINAIEAMEAGRGELRVSHYSSLEDVHIEIKDNGAGIGQETLKHLFDPFFTGKKKGMGLGLTSTQNIIQQHGGNIDVESEVGIGTTFTINLPKETKKDE